MINQNSGLSLSVIIVIFVRTNRYLYNFTVGSIYSVYWMYASSLCQSIKLIIDRAQYISKKNHLRYCLYIVILNSHILIIIHIYDKLLILYHDYKL